MVPLHLPRFGRAVAISILSGVLVLESGAIAQVSPSAPSSDLNQLVFNAPADNFDNEGRPPSRISAGSRSSCLNALVALVPGQGEISVEANCRLRSESRLALTVSEHPTLWFYIPETVDTGAIAELVLMNAALEPVSIQTIALDRTGIIGIVLNQPLEVGQVYHWALSLEGSTGSPFELLSVEGVIQRIEADTALSTPYPHSTDQERLRFYANQGLWHDALTLLIELHRNDPNDPTVADQWFSFLDSVGLGAIASAVHPR